ncbi:MAG: GyrI-like domain-containing protein [Methanocorpusculum sp.]|nr:GyrI-like domain-containing protein [Methanocorpusculum sp.]MDD3257646.1 GyrI-like domain-containing protein [Methanocorpusculum sp.]
MDKVDFKKDYKDLYQPKNTPSKILIPPMTFIMVEGKGNPNDEGGEFSEAVGLLYALCYMIKRSNKGDNAPERYYEYVVPPLEGLWKTNTFSRESGLPDKDTFTWTVMIRQPDFVTPDVFEWACGEVEKKKKKKKYLDSGKARLAVFNEGLCVQCMHKDSFDEEEKTLAKIEQFIIDNGLKNDVGEERHHHEIYISSPYITEAAKMKTVIRIPVKQAE